MVGSRQVGWYTRGLRTTSDWMQAGSRRHDPPSRDPRCTCTILVYSALCSIVNVCACACGPVCALGIYNICMGLLYVRQVAKYCYHVCIYIEWMRVVYVHIFRRHNRI